MQYETLPETGVGLATVALYDVFSVSLRSKAEGVPNNLPAQPTCRAVACRGMNNARSIYLVDFVV